MNVMLVSQCSKRALKETRRILDQFAERHGQRSWQTAITLEGLNTLHRLLRKTARKNTAVACFWIRGRNHSELLWIVGDASQFNEQGATPTNTTERDILRHQDENDWHTGQAIHLLGALAALFHDLGKANQAFQKKLTANKPVADAYRHEWVSLRLFESLVGDAEDDRQWLGRLAEADQVDSAAMLEKLTPDHEGRTRSPFKPIPPLARAIGWLIVSHHRLPMNPEYNAGINQRVLERLPVNLKAGWCGERPQRGDEKERTFQQLREQCWSFPQGTPLDSHQWREQAARLSKEMLNHDSLFEDWLDNPYALHLARLGLMLADHYYSGQPSHTKYGDRDFPLHANTDKDGRLKQRLDEHLIGVETNTSRLLLRLSQMERQLSRIARHRGFVRRSKDRRFSWQDKAFDLAAGIREHSRKQGFFGVNMASTGTGKTLANGRILYALADPRRGTRFNIALGLRTLTLQTGDAYRRLLHLGEEDMAVLVGGGAIRKLHERQQAESIIRGSKSLEDFMDNSSFVHFEGSLEDGPLSRWLKNNKPAQKLLAAPILISTIDHLMPATESTRGGHQIAPMLRMLDTDLVLDEPDDFDLNDLPALTRLVHWAGMLGSRVLLSSATLPPALVEGLFRAYRAGREIFQKNRGEPGQALNICCAWFDEFRCTASDCADTDHFAKQHQTFVEKRLHRLAKAPQRRKARVTAVEIEANTPAEKLYPEWARLLRDTAESLHQDHHGIDPRTGKRLSCGLIRMAHIEDIIATARALLKLGANPGRRIHLCVYHSRHPLLMRSRMEARLDRLLDRHDENALFQQPEIRELLDRHKEPDQLLIILASPVAEVGRDHDYDWAIVEPSSIRSIIQLAGRVRRHREGTVEKPNIALLQTNLKHLKTGLGQPAYLRPGFEEPGHAILRSHDLHELIHEEQLARIDASPRIRENPKPDPRTNLADLEHAQLRALMGFAQTEAIPEKTPVTHWFETRAHLSGELQRKQPFRHDPQGQVRYYLDMDEDDQLAFRRFEKQGAPSCHTGRLKLPEIEPGTRIGFLDDSDYTQALDDLSRRLDMEPSQCALQFGVIDLPEPKKESQINWSYHPALGFWKK
jgi:CRISPR-associated endonuclease/helicase Cas3